MAASRHFDAAIVGLDEHAASDTEEVTHGSAGFDAAHYIAGAGGERTTAQRQVDTDDLAGEQKGGGSMSRGGKHRASRGDVIHGPKTDSDTSHVDLETAAELLGLSIVELQWLCREGLVPHADVGAGYDQRGIHHDHLIVFTPDEVEQIHRQAKRPGPWVRSTGRNMAQEPQSRPERSGTSTSLSNDQQRREPGHAVG